MSRLGKTPILLPKGVEVKQNKDQVEVKGPKGQVKIFIPSEISLEIDDSKISLTAKPNQFLKSSTHGLYRSLLQNAVIGVSTGFKKELSLIGIGYRAAVKGKHLDLQLGFSHPCQIEIPEGLNVTIEKATSITISGIDKQLVGQFAANVRAFRPPEPYKGKGVRYIDEYVRKKAGKTAKGGK